MMPDHELLRRYAQDGDEAAFAELVRLYVDFVYSTAFRLVNNDAHAAQDVSQVVFTDLARKAWRLTGRTSVSGWLHTSVRYAAAKVRRTTARRAMHEQEAFAMQDHSTTPEMNWVQLRPLLDEAVGRLREAERDAVILRFFQNKSHREVGESLGLAEEAARKRVDRALEKLRVHFARRGVTVSSALLATAIIANSVQAAPAGLGASFSSSALAGVGSTFFFTSIVKTTYLTMKTKTIITIVVVATAAAIPLYLQHEEIAQLQSRLDAQEVRATRAVTASNGDVQLVGAGNTPQTIADPVAELNRILNLNSKAEIIRDLGQVLASIQPEQFPLLMEAFLQAPHTSNFSFIEPILLSLWAEHDPEAAIAWTHKLPKSSVEERAADVQYILRAWAALNPAAAATYAMKYAPTSPDEDAAFRAIVDGIVQDWSFTNPQAAWDWVQTLDEGGPKQNAERTIITNLARLNPEGAFNAAVSLPEDGPNGIRIKILNNVLYSWGEQDPVKAVSLLENISPNQVKKSGYATVAAAWYKHDPVVAMQWINSWTNLPVRDAAMRQFLNGQLKVPAKAFQVAMALQDDNLRQTSLIAVVQSWATANPQEAAAAVQSTSLPDQDKAALFNAIQAQAEVQSLDPAQTQ